MQTGTWTLSKYDCVVNIYLTVLIFLNSKFYGHLTLYLSYPKIKLPLYRRQSINLHLKSMGWFQYNSTIGMKWVKGRNLCAKNFVRKKKRNTSGIYLSNVTEFI